MISALLIAKGLALSICAICVIILVCFALYKKTKVDGTKVFDYATHNSEYNPTQFLIYDKSTLTECDRLIRVMPFDWYIWCIRGEIYILNPQSSEHCSIGTCPAIKVTGTEFIYVCLNLGYVNILKGYKSIDPKVVKYTITSKRFTILTALNILLKDWIKFDYETTLRIMKPSPSSQELATTSGRRSIGMNELFSNFSTSFIDSKHIHNRYREMKDRIRKNKTPSLYKLYTATS